MKSTKFYGALLFLMCALVLLECKKQSKKQYICLSTDAFFARPGDTLLYGWKEDTLNVYTLRDSLNIPGNSQKFINVESAPIPIEANFARPGDTLFIYND